MASDFREWIEQQLSQRGWKASDLARAAGIDQGTLSNVLNGARGAGLVFCNRVAAALRLPPETVLRHAGLLPDVPDEIAAGQEMAYLFARLTPEDQRRALAVVRALLADAARTGSVEPDLPGSEATGTPINPPLGQDSEDHLPGRVASGYRHRPVPPVTVGRRIGLGILILGAVLGILVLAFVKGSWWHPVATDRALDQPARAQVAAVRQRVALAGSAPEALIWLDLALASDRHPSDVRAYLLAARDELVAADDDRMEALIGELDVLIDSIRPASMDATAASPYPVSTVRSTPLAGP